MRVLVLGGSGFIGQAIAKRLAQTSGVTAQIASRHRPANCNVETVALDALDSSSLQMALSHVGSIVNCVGGNTNTIVGGASALLKAISNLNHRPTLVHLSTMSVYGSQEGTIDETSNLLADIGWYGSAKIRAESMLRSYAALGGCLRILRPGCVYGSGSALWTVRTGDLLRAGRLGDLGSRGDGWSNLVHVDDVAEAAVHCVLSARSEEVAVYNLSAPDSPRWNDYHKHFALAINAVPLRYLGNRCITLESMVLAPPLKVAERVLSRARIRKDWLPHGIPASLVRLWGQQIKLDSSSLVRDFKFGWTPYPEGLRQSTEYFNTVR